MRISSPRCLLVLIYILPWTVVCGQDSSLPIHTWIKQLSLKKDPRFAQYQEVVKGVGELDSVRRCEAIAQLDRRGPDKKRYRIKFNLLLSTLHPCPGWKTKDVLVKEALRMAYVINDTTLIAECNRYFINFYQEKGDYGTAGMYGLITRELQDKVGPEHFLYLAYARYDLGYVLYHSREYAAAIKVTRDAIHWKTRPGAAPGDSLATHYQMFAWNTIGLAYDKLGLYDSAFVAFENAKRISTATRNDFWTALIKGNEGALYFKMGQFDTAEALLRTDYLQSKASNDRLNAASSLLLLAQVHATQSKGQLALAEVREAYALAQPDPGRERQANLYYAYSRAFKALGHADSLDYYMLKYLELYTALEKEAEYTRAGIVRMRIDNQDAMHRIIVLNNEKERIALIRNFSIVCIAIMTAFGFLLFNRQRLRIRLQQKEMEEAKAKAAQRETSLRLAEAEAKAASEKLGVFTQRILEKTNLVEQLQEQLLQKELNAEQIQQISALSTHAILTDDDWEQFKSLFEKVYPGFFVTLKHDVPDITVAEQRMAALSKLRVSTKEAANLLGISPNSVVKSKSRLRQRLHLDPEADLEKYFSEETGTR